jgi:hypothetical protein
VRVVQVTQLAAFPIAVMEFGTQHSHIKFPIPSDGDDAETRMDNRSHAWLRAPASEPELRTQAPTICVARSREWCWQSYVDERLCVRWMAHSSAKMVREVYGKPSQAGPARDRQTDVIDEGRRAHRDAIAQFHRKRG